MSPSRRSAFILMGAFALTVVIARVLPAPRVAAPTPAKTAPLPATLAGGYIATANPDETTPTTRAMLAPGTQMDTRTYRGSEGGASVQVIRITGSDRNALHDPRSCLAGVGWRIEDDRTEIAEGVPVRVCRLAAPDRAPLLVAYGYVSENGILFANPSAIRAQLLRQAILGGAAKPVTFLRLITSGEPGQTEASRKRLRFLAADLIRTVAATPSQ